MDIQRLTQNPLISPSDVIPSMKSFEVIGTFNAAATTYNNQTLLLLRVAERPAAKTSNSQQIAPIFNPITRKITYLKIDNSDPDLVIPDPRVFVYKGRTYLTSISHLRLARSNDGINFEIDKKPTIFPETPYETFGLEDPRITMIDSKYYITCKAVSEKGICTQLIETQDFISFDRKGITFCPENLDVVLFPEKINGLYYALTRPVPKNIGPLAIWCCSSPDLQHWGNHKILIIPKTGKSGVGRVGASCPPIKTSQGWLEIYHGADSKNRYCLFAALLKLDDPSHVIAVSKNPIMQPEASYEIKGFFGNVVFSCGAIASGDEITIYYGASDEVTAAAKTSVSEILNSFD